MNSIILFEDDISRRDQIHKALSRSVDKNVKIKLIDGEIDFQRNITYESLIKDMLSEIKPGEALIVCDKDLSGLGKFLGLSGTVVAAVADELGFPICLYARGTGEQEGEEFLRSLSPWEKKRIILDSRDVETLVAQSLNLFKGFQWINNEYRDLSLAQASSPPKALANLLGVPEVEEQIALYGSGEQGLLEEIMPFIGDNHASSKANITGRMVRVLGNWLYTSILRFPGLLVNQIAAASYLNINVDAFKDDSVQDLFKIAQYNGPFSGANNKYWWRHKLDDLLLEEKCPDGNAYANYKGKKVDPCLDEVTNTEAGYYCMVTRKPVSAENSKGGISWFPAGANLSRIRIDKFDELAPWLGLY
ncbi:MAG: hypothetical protein K9N35_02630 [Candidatus Marinimicrobia bacterium]|nr:hypothetical protein [Candidatus Neomarinimicrobiota bacterium]